MKAHILSGVFCTIGLFGFMAGYMGLDSMMGAMDAASRAERLAAKIEGARYIVKKAGTGVLIHG